MVLSHPLSDSVFITSNKPVLQCVQCCHMTCLWLRVIMCLASGSSRVSAALVEKHDVIVCSWGVNLHNVVLPVWFPLSFPSSSHPPLSLLFPLPSSLFPSPAGELPTASLPSLSLSLNLYLPPAYSIKLGGGQKHLHELLHRLLPGAEASLRLGLTVGEDNQAASIRTTLENIPVV